MIMPADITFSDLYKKTMDKVFCSECKHCSYHKEDIIFCDAWEKGEWLKDNDNWFSRGEEYKSEWREKDMKIINKNNNCPYYEKNI